MRHYILTVVVATAILFAIVATGTATVVVTNPETHFFSGQILWWSLGVVCLAVPVASILWKAGTMVMVGVITTALLATSWVTAIASAGGMVYRGGLPLHPLASLTAAIVATMAMVVAWVTFSAPGRQLSRSWTLPIRVLTALGYWVLIGAVFSNPWVHAWVAQFYEDMLAFPTTGLFSLMDGASYPAEIYHILLGDFARSLPGVGLDHGPASRP